MSNEFNFFKWAIATCLVVLAASALFNYIIDPYNLFHSPEFPGINTSKAGAGDRIALSKTYMAEVTNAETVILGTSKFDIGIDPASKSIPLEFAPVFNFSVPGAGIYDLYRYLQHVTVSHRPRLVIIELGFEAFLSHQDRLVKYPPTRNEYEERLLVNYDGSVNGEKTFRTLKDYLAALFSNAAIYDSYKTILSGDKVWLDRNGLSSDELRFGPEVRNKGHFSVFRDVIRRHLKRDPDRRLVDDSVATRALDDILMFGKNNSVNLVFVIPPLHAYMYELLDVSDSWNQFEQWKQLLVEKIDAATSTSNVSISLWDYAWYSSVTMEAVPPPHDMTPMEWYWEPIHFKRGLGDIILHDVLYGKGSGIGVQLTSENICQHLLNVRRLKDHYQHEKKDQISQFHNIITDNNPTELGRKAARTPALNCR